MAALVRIAPNLRTILAAQVALQFMDRRVLRPADDVERDRLMRVAAEAPNLKVTITGIQCVADGRRRLGRSLIAKHAIVPRLTREPVSFFPRMLGTLGRGSDRGSVNAFAGFGGHAT